jgi:hypothetical protein
MNAPKVPTDLPDGAFKNYTLYIYPGDKNSNTALTVLNNNTSLRGNVHVQNIEHLSNLPVWLDGVPVVEDQKQERAYKGTACIEWLKTNTDVLGNAPIGRNQVSGGKLMAFEDGAVIADARQGATEEWSESSDMHTNSKISSDDVETYMQKRAAATHQAKNKQEPNKLSR